MRKELKYIHFSVCVCLSHPEIGWDMNMHKAKRYTQVTYLNCVAAENNCTRQMFSLPVYFFQEQGNERQKRTVISWEHFSLV